MTFQDGIVFFRHDGLYRETLAIRAPHAVGDVLPVREGHWYRESDGLTVFDNGDFCLHETSLLGAKQIKRQTTEEQDRWWRDDVPRMAELGFERRPADTLPDWAVRRHASILSVTPKIAHELTADECERGQIYPDTLIEMARSVGVKVTFQLWLWLYEVEEVRWSRGILEE